MKRHGIYKGKLIPNIDLQHEWMIKYKIDSVRLGKMCHEYPALKKSWDNFKMVYKLCEAEHEANREVPKVAG